MLTWYWRRSGCGTTGGRPNLWCLSMKHRTSPTGTQIHLRDGWRRNSEARASATSASATTCRGTACPSSPATRRPFYWMRATLPAHHQQGGAASRSPRPWILHHWRGRGRACRRCTSGDGPRSSLLSRVSDILMFLPLRAPLRRRRLAGAERLLRSCLLRASQGILNRFRGRMRAAEYAPRGPFRLLERRHGFTEIVERGGRVLGQNRRRATRRQNTRRRTKRTRLTLRRGTTTSSSWSRRRRLSIRVLFLE